MAVKYSVSMQDSKRWVKECPCASFACLPSAEGKPDSELVRLVEAGRIRKGRALDMCAGAGSNLRYLAEKGFDVFAGVDVSREALMPAVEEARGSGMKIKLSFGDGGELKLEDKSFDLVLDRGCFHRIPPFYRKRYLEGIRKMLKDGGKYMTVCLSDRNEPGVLSAFDRKGIDECFAGCCTIVEAKEIRRQLPTGGSVALWSVLMEKKA